MTRHAWTRWTLVASLLLLGCSDCSGAATTETGDDTTDATPCTDGIAVAVVDGPTTAGWGLYAELTVSECSGGPIDDAELVFTNAAGDTVSEDALTLAFLGGSWAVTICPGADGEVTSPLTVTATSGTDEATTTLTFDDSTLDAELCSPDLVDECKLGCDGGVCTETGCCQPSCQSKMCGPDGCGGTCGTCESTKSCGPNQVCIGPWLFVPGVHDPRGLAADADHLYFAIHGSGAIMRLAHAEGEPVELAIAVGATAVELDDTHVYWSASVDGVIQRMPKAIDEAAVPAPETLADAQQSPKGIDVDGTHVYWANAAGKSIWRVAKDGSGDPELVADKLKGPQAVRVDDTHVFWTESSGGKVVRLAKDDPGGLPETIAAGQDKPWRLYVDDQHVYFTNYVIGGTVVRVGKSGGDLEILAQDLNTPNDIIGNDTYVYYSAVGLQENDFKNGAVYRHPKDGTNQLIANNQPSAGFLTLGYERLYWGQGGTFKEGFVDGNVLAFWQTE